MSTATSMKPDTGSDAAAQAARRERVHALDRATCLGLYRDDGSFALDRDVDLRGHLWHAMAFLGGDAPAVRRANAMLRHVAPPRLSGHFWTSATTSILARYRPRLEADVVALLTAGLAAQLDGEAGQRCRGYNDNYPAMAALSLCVGAPLIGRGDLVEDGRENLRSWRRLLTRRGLLSEFTSPTYSGITLSCLAEIAELSPDPESRELALQAEARVWADLCARFHPETSSIAGPHSRAYMADLLAHPHTAHVVMWMVLGDAAAINPITAIYPPAPGQVVHNRHNEGLQGHAAWQSTPTYHIPPACIELALGKRYPVLVEGTAEQAAFPRNFWSAERHPRTPHAEVPAAELRTQTWMRAEFALGVSDRPFLDGYQASCVHLVWPHGARARSPHELATLFPRYLVGAEQPRRDTHCNDHGRYLTVAREGSVLALAWPKPAWGMRPPVQDIATTPVSRLRLALVVSTIGRMPDELWLGDRRAEAWEGSAEQATSVYLRDGALFLALHPVIGADLGRGAAVRLAAHDGLGLIELVNYEGTPRTFVEHELPALGNGFVLEAAAAGDWPSFAAFRAAHAEPCISDTWRSDDAMRCVRYERAGLELAIDASPYSDGARYRTVDGRVPETPRFRVTGWDAPLPWL